MTRICPVAALFFASALSGRAAFVPRHLTSTPYFEPNRGQTSPAAAFVARGQGYTIFLRPDGSAVYQLSSGTGETTAILRLELAGGSQAIRAAGEQLLPSVTNYYHNRDGLTVPNYGSVRMSGVYPGVDMLWRSRAQELEYEFPVAAGADPRQIQLRFTGARRIGIDRGGNLVLDTNAGRLCHRRPVAWQEIDGRRVRVDARFRLAGASVTFQLGRYDHRQPLWIDPVLTYSSYVGGAGFDSGYAVALDTSGNIYMTGTTASVGFPSNGTLVSLYRDAFVTEFTASGSMVYTTILSGTGDSYGQAIAIDSAGNVYVAGYTAAPDFPATPGAWQTLQGGGIDAFIAKLAPGGSVLWATYAGGAGNDYATGIAVGGAGNTYVSGYTSSSMNFPVTMGAAQPVYGGGPYDAFVINLNAAGSNAIYSTLLGGSGNDMAQSIVLYPTDSVCIAGYTESTNLPVVAALQSTPGGEGDALIGCLNPAGTAWTTVTYLGGSGMDEAYALAIDATGYLYMVGATFSTDFPTTPNAFQAAPAGSYDAFAVKLYPNATGVVYSTLLGGSGSDTAAAVAVASTGNIWIAGYTNSTNFPLMTPLAGFEPRRLRWICRGTELGWQHFAGIQLSGRHQRRSDLGDGVSPRGNTVRNRFHRVDGLPHHPYGNRGHRACRGERVSGGNQSAYGRLFHFRAGDRRRRRASGRRNHHAERHGQRLDHHECVRKLRLHRLDGRRQLHHYALRQRLQLHSVQPELLELNNQPGRQLQHGPGGHPVAIGCDVGDRAQRLRLPVPPPGNPLLDYR
jgi:hypothetical protein